MAAVAELALHVGLRTACQVFSVNRALVYRERLRCRPTVLRRVGSRVRARPPLALSMAEQDMLLGLLNSERFADVAPVAVYATLLDEGRYHGSIRTMYRLLAARNQTGERRRQRVHPVYANRNCSPCDQLRCGVGISQKSRELSNGKPTSSM
jgi:putative transposase